LYPIEKKSGNVIKFAARRKKDVDYSRAEGRRMRCASFFAGVGGIEKGFIQEGFDIIYANEMDRFAIETYELNFDIKVDPRMIQEVKGEEVPDCDLIMGGFPCQAFSIAGYQKGFEDKERGLLFFELLRIIKVKKPRVVFCENVKNLVGHDKGNTFRVIKDALESAGYEIKYAVLNAMEFGNIPQNRERIYIVGFRNHDDYRNFEFPDPIPLTTSISDLVDFNEKVDYTSDNCPFYSKLEESITRTDTFYQWRRVYVRENKSNVCPTLTANMGEGGHNVPLVLTRYGIRKITPHEAFNLQGFPKDYKLPERMAQTHLYKQAGNSVVVPVIRRIAANIRQAINETDMPVAQDGNNVRERAFKEVG
jgi:DNA (cytosine-5)-methyltransferase 1